MSRIAFSVVIATYDRGQHIVPTVRSVLAQTLKEFELLIVGDHCTDDTEAVLQPFLSERVRWINLAERGGSQSFPNNEGIAQSRGRYIAYLGHDDIWAPDHLASLNALIETTGADYVVSGDLLHSPPGVDLPRVTGIFDGPAAAIEHFFPPSSIAHKRDLTDRIGPWQDPLTTRAPVDADLQLRAARAGMSFASTKRVTVHKFTATQRYLGYLSKDSTEQAEFLELLLSGASGPLVQRNIERARELGLFMSDRMPDFEAWQPGSMHRYNASLKGSIVSDQTTPLGEIAIFPARAGTNAFDWDEIPRNGFLWNASHLRPRFRIPFSHPSGGLVTVVLAHRSDAALRGIEVTGAVSDVLVSDPVQVGDHWEAAMSFRVTLNAEYGAVIGFKLRPDQRGLGLGTFILRPAPRKDPRERIRSLRARVRSLKRQLSRIRSSRTWRLAARLRFLLGVFRRG